MTEIAKKLKELRKQKKLTQQELADRVKITRSTISNYEIGRRTPHLKDLRRLADFFGVSLEYFDFSQVDEVFDLIFRANNVFKSDKITIAEKDEIYRIFMQMYLSLKENEK